jgi:hypothetical protein
LKQLTIRKFDFGADKALNVELDAGVHVTKLAKQQAPQNGPAAGKSSRRQNKKATPVRKRKSDRGQSTTEQPCMATTPTRR